MQSSVEIPIAPGIQALIFDCDGTLADTMPFHMSAWKEALAALNQDYPEDFFFPLKGMKEEEIVELYNQKFQQNLDAAQVLAAKHRRFREKLPLSKPIEPVTQIAHRFYKKLPMAVVSGGTQENVWLTLKIIGVEELFDVVLTADDDIKPKPAPDIFLEAARRLEVEPQFCQVFEDGDLGLKAARMAGMTATDVRPYL